MNHENVVVSEVYVGPKQGCDGGVFGTRGDSHVEEGDSDHHCLRPWPKTFLGEIAEGENPREPPLDAVTPGSDE